MTSQVPTRFVLSSLSRHVSFWFQVPWAEDQTCRLRLVKGSCPSQSVPDLSASAVEHLTYAPRLRERVEAEQDEQHGETRHQIEPHQSCRGLAAIEEPFGERNLGAGKSQTQKGDADQQLEEPLGVQKAGTQKIAKFTQDSSGQPAPAGELQPQAML